MNKQEFIKALATSADVIQKQANEIISAAFELIQTEVANGGSVEIVGFGSFVAVEREERVGHNPKTKEKLIIPAKISPRFKPGKTFNELVAGSK